MPFLLALHSGHLEYGRSLMMLKRILLFNTFINTIKRTSCYIFLFYSLAIFPLQKIPICPRVGVSYEGFFLFTYLHATILRLHMFAPTPSVLLLYQIYTFLHFKRLKFSSSTMHLVLIVFLLANQSLISF